MAIKQKLTALKSQFHEIIIQLTESGSQKIARKLSELLALAEEMNSTSHQARIKPTYSSIYGVVTIFWESAGTYEIVTLPEKSKSNRDATVN